MVLQVAYSDRRTVARQGSIACLSDFGMIRDQSTASNATVSMHATAEQIHDIPLDTELD